MMNYLRVFLKCFSEQYEGFIDSDVFWMLYTILMITLTPLIVYSFGPMYENDIYHKNVINSALFFHIIPYSIVSFPLVFKILNHCDFSFNSDFDNNYTSINHVFALCIYYPSYTLIYYLVGMKDVGVGEDIFYRNELGDRYFDLVIVLITMAFLVIIMSIVIIIFICVGDSKTSWEIAKSKIKDEDIKKEKKRKMVSPTPFSSADIKTNV